MFYLHVEFLHHGNLGLITALYRRCPSKLTEIPLPTFAWQPLWHTLPAFKRTTGCSRNIVPTEQWSIWTWVTEEIADNVVIARSSHEGQAGVCRWIYKDIACKEQWWAPDIRGEKFQHVGKTKVIVNYNYLMSTKTKFNVIYCSHMFHSHSILKSTFPTPSTFPS